MTRPKIPLVIVESHQHVLEHVHDAIRRQKLFGKPWSMLHFDAHPDLACPRVAPAIACFAPRQTSLWDDAAAGQEDQNNLYEMLDSTSTGIAEWITPLVLAANLSRIEWVKPKFSRQLPLGRHNFAVGAEADSPDGVATFLDLPRESRIKVDWHHPYYLDDGSVVPSGRLALKRELELRVSELPSSTEICGVPPNARGKDDDDDDDDDDQPWMLDICLDYFVCRNPYVHDIEEVDPETARAFLDVMEGSTVANTELATSDYETDVAAFYDLLVKALATPPCPHGPTDDPEWAVPPVHASLSRFFANADEADRLITNLATKIRHDRALLAMVVEAVPNWSMPHMSSEEATSFDHIDESLRLVKEDLRRRRRKAPPFLITVARSSLDGFTPPAVVEYLQTNLLQALRGTFCGTDCPEEGSSIQGDCTTGKLNEHSLQVVRDYGEWEGSTIP
jgi:hypothetical protein